MNRLEIIILSIVVSAATTIIIDIAKLIAIHIEKKKAEKDAIDLINRLPIITKEEKDDERDI